MPMFDQNTMAALMGQGGGGGAPVGPNGGMSSLMTAIRSMMGNPLQRGGMGGAPMGQSGGGMGQGGLVNGMDPNMLMMHLMNGGSLASLMQMMQARQGQPQGVMGMAPQMNPAGGMMSALQRTMAR